MRQNARFGHKEAELTILLLMMGILVLKYVESINQNFVASSSSLSYIISTMHGHTNFRFTQTMVTMGIFPFKEKSPW
jgi:hypothetical protein